MKQLLLDKQQILLYNFSPKPIITLKDKDEKSEQEGIIKKTPTFEKVGEYKHLLFAYSAL